MQVGSLPSKYVHAIISPATSAFMYVGNTMDQCINELENSMDQDYTGPRDNPANINAWLHANGFPCWFVLENTYDDF